MNSKVEIGEKEKNSAKDWFEELRNHICGAFEKIEISQESGPFSHLKPGKFERKITSRENKGNHVFMYLFFFQLQRTSF